ncbi:hypothetical protein [Sphingomonas soli]|uniref:hypothetical protein n=1 Tax=Sphingomonas soli TaxID=266127 RepID=UPI0012EEBEC7|nr:hypothetical protein [Sphingomonas soli]
MIRLFIAIAFAAGSCSAPADQSGPSDAAIWTVAQTDIKAKLRDPGSAEFSELHTIRRDGKALGTCGKVNSKNGFGGMSGPTRFIAGGDISAVEGDGTMDQKNFNEAWSMMCL